MKHHDTGAGKGIMFSFRLSSAFLELIEAECDARKVSVSEFVRQSILANMRYMRRQAREAWSKQAS
jgi:Ribbon-helix-helix protein, copG family